jgi:hypothetical protein
MLRFITRCMTWRAFLTFATRFALLAWFTRLAWLTWLAGFLRVLLVGRVVMLSRGAVVSVFCRTFFTWCAVTTLAAVTAVAVA